jgi:flavin reductase (DIM6/NTAB) family NADH-FMN oxidoreductase RutF
MDVPTSSTTPPSSGAACETIACSRVAAAPAALECKLTQIVAPARQGQQGGVRRGHRRATCVTTASKDGIFDVTQLQPAGTRMGYKDYTVVREKFAIARPGES